MNTIFSPSVGGVWPPRFLKVFPLFLLFAFNPKPATLAAPTIAAHSQDQIEALQREKAARSPSQRKLDSQLLYLGKQERGEPIARGVTHQRSGLRRHTDGRVLVDIQGDLTPALIAEIERGRGTILNRFPKQRAMRAWVPVTLIESLASSRDVQHIRPAAEATTNSGLIDSQGDVTHLAAEARLTYGIGGDGVKIGVLSDSVDYLSDSQARGELPREVTVLPGQAGTSGKGEGTAMLELIHDLAPQSELYFATAFSSEASFAENIRSLYAAGCRVIVDDVSYFRESPFQNDLISRAILEVSAGGALYFSAAGNSGNKNDNTAGVWEGDFLDGGPATVGRGGRFHDFGGNTVNSFVAGGGFRRVDLFWADPLGLSANDYDVYLLDANGQVVASSTNVQNGNDDPYEAIPNVVSGDRIVIVKFSGENRYLRLATGRGRLAIATAGAVSGHNASSAPNALSVAATWVRSPATPFLGGPVNPTEPFSSDGPRHVFFNPDGSAITPGNFSSTGGRLISKPDLTAADGISTSVPGFEAFFGTSAAAPHAAAIAALVWSYNPALSPASVRAALLQSALDIEAVGQDSNSGAGIVMAPSAVEAAPAPPPRLGYDSALILGGNGNGTFDPNECNQVFLQLRSGIGANGATATGVRATLRSLTSDVSIEAIPVNFQDAPASGTTTNTEPFLISTRPTFVCGTPVALELSIEIENGLTTTQRIELSSTPPLIAPPVSFPAIGTPLLVPDLATVDSQAIVSGISLPVAQITVSLHLTHTYVSDLVLTLIGPDGTAVLLSSRNGNGGQNYGSNCSAPTVFDDLATRTLVFDSAPFEGAVQPQSPLAVFNGKSGSDLNGIWTLRVSDVAEPDSGIIQCWTLRVAPIQCLDGSGACFAAPTFLAQPRSILGTNGLSAEFVALADGTAPFAYQWFFQETNAIPGATESDLVLPQITPADAGYYSVVVSNRYGVATSDPALLTVVLPPMFVVQPESVIATNGNDVTFSVVALGTAPLHYQWYRDGTLPLAGATQASLLLSAVGESDAGSYSVLVSNPFGSASSANADLKVVEPPSVLQQPSGTNVNAGSTVMLSVVAKGSLPLSYQWYRNETIAIDGATTATLLLLNIAPEQSGGYLVVVSNRFGILNSSEAVVTVTVPNQAPRVFLTSPPNGQSYQDTTLPVSISAAASDPDGQLDRIEFYADGALLFSSAVSPYTFEWRDPFPGNHRLWAVAIDTLGGRGTSSVAQITVQMVTPATSVLVSTGSVWKYLDTGTDQGTNWITTGFDDSSWLAGPAELGYGDKADGRLEATVIGFGPNAASKYITYYFRQSFLELDPTAYTNLHVRLMRDDGGVVYLNGVEIFRSNLPAGKITSSTLALSSVGGAAETTFFETNAPASLLLNGTNILAVEIHQNQIASSDISFDLELKGTRQLGPRILAGPADVTIAAGESADFSVAATGDQPLTYRWFFNRTNKLSDATNPELSLLNVAVDRAGLYSVVITNLHGSVTSSAALLSVAPSGPNQPPAVSLSAPVADAVYDTDQLPVPLRATATDEEGPVVRVDFFSDGLLLASLSAPPFQFDWHDPRVGLHRLTVVATDEGGLSFTSSVVQLTVNLSDGGKVSLVRSGEVWKYNDTGSDLGVEWIEVGYNDSAWSSGPAELGYGDTTDGRPEATPISYGPNPKTKYPTAYFRHSFTLADPAAFNGIRFKLLRDDGAAVYLNGVEMFRDNLPAGTLQFSSFATKNISGTAETNLVIKEFAASGLREGINTLAVEVHQSAVNSTDLSFEMTVETTLPVTPQIAEQPTDQSVPEGGIASFSVSARGLAPLYYQWYFNQTELLPDATNATLQRVNVSPSDAGQYQCLVSNLFGSILSSKATLTVLPPAENLPPSISLISPASDTVIDLGSTVPLVATAGDTDGQVVLVEFFGDAVLLGNSTATPYKFDWAGASLGRHTVVAKATDNLGLSSTSSPVTLTVAIPATLTGTVVATGSVWKYLDTGVDQGSAWRRTTFNDTSWKSGRALLGYGNAAKGRPEATLLSFGPDPKNRYPTYYFRRSFVVTNLAQIVNLELRVLRDDGVAIYLNNQRIWRNNVPNGTLSFHSLALTPITGADETQYLTNQIATTQLISGTNVLAVELHQASVASDDLAFDLGLRANLNSPPIFLSQPSDLTVDQGASASFTVTAFGSGTLSYQWYFNGSTALSGATLQTLTLENVTSNHSGLYSVTVRNSAGSILSASARLTVIVPSPNLPPLVTLTSPTNNSTFYQGSIISLEANASDPDGSIISVDFYSDAEQLIHLTNSPYLFDWLSAPVGTHHLRALARDNRGATNLSAAVTLLVSAPPPPPSLTISLVSTGAVWRYLDSGADLGKSWRLPSFDDTSWSEGPAELGYGDGVEGRPEATLLSYGNDPLSKHVTYYFRHSFELTNVSSFSDLRIRLMRDDGGVVYLNSTEIFRSNMPTGAVTSATLASSAVNKQLEHTFYETNILASSLVNGTNVLAVEIHQNAVTSSDISFDFELIGSQLGPPIIVSQPQDQSVPEGASAQFAVVAVGATPLSYRWFFNGLDALPDATNSSLTLTSVTSVNEGSYSVVVSNVGGSAHSASAVLSVIVPPIILTQPESRSVGIGGGIDFTVEASGTGPLIYQWFFNTTPLSSQTNATLQLTAVRTSNAGTYSVRVTNPGGSVLSSAATLTVVTSLMPVILSQPQGLSALIGSSAEFSVNAAGTPPLGYQWFFGTNSIVPGATNSTLSLASVGVANMGFYSVRVTNQSGSITSAPAELRVLVRPSLTGLVFNSSHTDLRFPSVSRLIYSVEFKDRITNLVWSALPAASLLKGTGSDIKVSDPSPNPVVRFYRVKVE